MHACCVYIEHDMHAWQGNKLNKMQIYIVFTLGQDRIFFVTVTNYFVCQSNKPIYTVYIIIIMEAITTIFYLGELHVHVPYSSRLHILSEELGNQLREDNRIAFILACCSGDKKRNDALLINVNNWERLGFRVVFVIKEDDWNWLGDSILNKDRFALVYRKKIHSEYYNVGLARTAFFQFWNEFKTVQKRAIVVFGDDRRKLYSNVQYDKEGNSIVVGGEVQEQHIDNLLKSGVLDEHMILSPAPQDITRHNVMYGPLMRHETGVCLQRHMKKHHWLAQIFIASAETWYHFVDTVGIAAIEATQAPIFEDLAFPDLAYYGANIQLGMWYQARKQVPKQNIETIARNVVDYHTRSDSDRLRLWNIMESLVVKHTGPADKPTTITVRQGLGEIILTKAGSEVHLQLYSHFLKRQQLNIKFK